MSSNNHILNLADQCVKCGMCLPHCPTYLASQLESESPRGRIAIIQGLLNNQISNNLSALTHIDNCLTCRACENICPSDVQYGALLDQFKNQQHGKLQPIQKRLHKSLIRFVLLNKIVSKRLLPWLLSATKSLKIEHLFGLSNSPAKQTRQIYKSNNSKYPTQNASLQNNNPSVGLFIGCTGASFDRQTLNDAILVLNTIGFDVFISDNDNCCGALDSHAGNESAALQLATHNIKSFHDLNVDHIVYFATGCGALLSEYHLINWTSTEQKQQAQAFSKKLSEITTFIHQYWPEHIVIKNQTQSIAVHEPCTHRNVLKESDISYKLFARIAGLTVLPMTQNKLCCGAAGDYMMTHSKMANLLREPKLKEISELTPDIVVTTNIGCAMHLRKGLYRKKQVTPVIHPLSLLAKLLAK